MPGAYVEVLMPTVMNEHPLAALEAYVDAVADPREGNGFWIAGLPFDYYPPGAPEDDSEYGALSWLPAQVIGFSAGSRGQASDLFLGMMACRVAGLFGGLIALRGDLTKLCDNPSVLTFEGRFGTEAGDVVSPEFMRYWMGCPGFRLFN